MILINNSLMQFMVAAAVLFAASAVFVMLWKVQGNNSGASSGYMDRAWAEINMTHLRHNVKALQEVLPDGCEMMAVVKANAYGHGDIPVCRCLNRAGIHAFAVATIDEGIRLRWKGIRGTILVLGYTPAERTRTLFRYRLSQTVADMEHARELDCYGIPVQVHIKVNTGMNRLGESYRNADKIASIFNCKNLQVAGMFTHLCVPDGLKKPDIAFTYLQIHRFCNLIDQLKAKHIRIPPLHLQSSYGVLNYPSLPCSYARVGIALYGVLSSPHANTRCSVDLQPVLALKSRVTLVRTVPKGECVGYGRSFIAQEETRIAVISIGYADGIPRSLSNNGHVLIRGCRAPIIGRICMDQLTVEVTGIPDIKRGDVVTLIGRDGSEEITAEQMASNAGTITNELLSRLGDFRLKRVCL